MSKFLNHLIAIAVALTFSLQVLAQNGPPFEPQFLMPADPDVVVISYSETPDMLANPDSLPMIRVFGDGEVLVHYPAYMKRAGDYQVFLNPGELRQLLISLSGVFEFNASAVGLEKQRAQRSKAPSLLAKSERSDKTLEQINVELDGYRNQTNDVKRSVRKQIKWRDIEVDAETYPGVTDLVALEKARRSLRKLLERHDLMNLRSGVTVSPLVEAGDVR
jgi:hypothetical protein